MVERIQLIQNQIGKKDATDSDTRHITVGRPLLFLDGDDAKVPILCFEKVRVARFFNARVLQGGKGEESEEVNLIYILPY